MTRECCLRLVLRRLRLRLAPPPRAHASTALALGATPNAPALVTPRTIAPRPTLYSSTDKLLITYDIMWGATRGPVLTSNISRHCFSYLIVYSSSRFHAVLLFEGRFGCVCAANQRRGTDARQVAGHSYVPTLTCGNDWFHAQTATRKGSGLERADCRTVQRLLCIGTSRDRSSCHRSRKVSKTETRIGGTNECIFFIFLLLERQ